MARRTYNKPEKWKALDGDILWDRCRTFNQKAERFYSGKDMKKEDTVTWGKCATDCIRHLEVLSEISYSH